MMEHFLSERFVKQNGNGKNRIDTYIKWKYEKERERKNEEKNQEIYFYFFMNEIFVG